MPVILPCFHIFDHHCIISKCSLDLVPSSSFISGLSSSLSASSSSKFQSSVTFAPSRTYGSSICVASSTLSTTTNSTYSNSKLTSSTSTSNATPFPLSVSTSSSHNPPSVTLPSTIATPPPQQHQPHHIVCPDCHEPVPSSASQACHMPLARALLLSIIHDNLNRLGCTVCTRTKHEPAISLCMDCPALLCRQALQVHLPVMYLPIFNRTIILSYYIFLNKYSG